MSYRYGAVEGWGKDREDWGIKAIVLVPQMQIRWLEEVYMYGNKRKKQPCRRGSGQTSNSNIMILIRHKSYLKAHEARNILIFLIEETRKAGGLAQWWSTC